MKELFEYQYQNIPLIHNQTIFQGKRKNSC